MAEAPPIFKDEDVIRREWDIHSGSDKEVEIYSPGGTKLLTIRMPVMAVFRDLKTRITELSGKIFLTFTVL